MAIHGFFSREHLALVPTTAPTAVPYVRAAIQIPSLRRQVVASFLIDTGADTTVIHPQDSLRLFQPAEIRALPSPVGIDGAGAGKAHYPIEVNIVFLHHDNSLQAVPITAYVGDPSHNMNFESLLGRDVLESFVMHFDQKAQSVTFE